MASGGSTLQYLVYHCLEPVPSIVEVAFGTPPQAIVQAVTTMGGRFGDDRVRGFVVEVWVEEMNGWVDSSVRIEELVARRKVRVAAALNPPALPQLPQLPDLSGVSSTVPPVVTTTDYQVGTAPNPPALPPFPDLSAIAMASSAVQFPGSEKPNASSVHAVPSTDPDMAMKLGILTEAVGERPDGVIVEDVHAKLQALRPDLLREKGPRYELMTLSLSDFVIVKFIRRNQLMVKLTEHATADELVEGIMHASETGRIAYSEMTSTMARVRPDLFGNEEQQHAAIEKAVADNRLFVSEQDGDSHVFVSFPARCRGGLRKLEAERLAENVEDNGGSFELARLIDYAMGDKRTLGSVAIAQDQGLLEQYENENGVPFVKLGSAWLAVDHDTGLASEDSQKVLDVIVEEVAGGAARTLAQLDKVVKKRFPVLCGGKNGRDLIIQKAVTVNRIRISEPLHDRSSKYHNVAIPGSERDELAREFGVLVNVMRNRPNGMMFADVSEELERCNPRRFRDQRDADTLIRRAIDYPFLVTLDQPGDPLMLAEEATDAQLVYCIVRSGGSDSMEWGRFHGLLRRARGNNYYWRQKRDAVIQELVAAGKLFTSISQGRGSHRSVSLKPIETTTAETNGKRQRSPPRPAEADDAPLVLPQYKPLPFAGSVAMAVGAPLPQYIPPSHQPGPAAPPFDVDEGLPMALPRLEEPPTAFGAGGGPPQQ